MKRLILAISFVSLACGASAALPSAIPAPTPEHAVYYQAIGDVNIRETPDGVVVGVLHTGDKVRSAGVVVRTDGVRWCKHERGWSACEWLRVSAPTRVHNRMVRLKQ